MRNSIEANRMRNATENSGQSSSKQHSNHHHSNGRQIQSSSVSSSSSYHRKSQSLDAATIASQIANSSGASTAANKNKTNTHKER